MSGKEESLWLVVLKVAACESKGRGSSAESIGVGKSMVWAKVSVGKSIVWTIVSVGNGMVWMVWAVLLQWMRAAVAQQGPGNRTVALAPGTLS